MEHPQGEYTTLNTLNYRCTGESRFYGKQVAPFCALLCRLYARKCVPQLKYYSALSQSWDIRTMMLKTVTGDCVISPTKG